MKVKKKKSGDKKIKKQTSFGTGLQKLSLQDQHELSLMLNRRKMRRIFENFPLSRGMIQEYLLYIVHPTRVASKFKMEKITIFTNTIENLDSLSNE